LSIYAEYYCYFSAVRVSLSLIMKQLFTPIALSLALLCTYDTSAQQKYHPNFIGINPSVTVEPYYHKGEMDINVFPLVYQRPLTRRLDVRLNTIANLGIRNNGSEVSHFGLETAFPFFIIRKEEKKECSKGFFAAPVVSLTRNRLEEHNNVGLWVEPGYHLLFDNRLALSFGLQVGTTYFAYDAGGTKWGNHFGVKVIFGRWI